VDSRVGESFTSFFSTQSGWGNLEFNDNEIILKVAYGYLDLRELNFTHEKGLSAISKISVASEEIQSRFEQEDGLNKVLFEKELKLDRGDEMIVSFK